MCIISVLIFTDIVKEIFLDVKSKKIIDRDHCFKIEPFRFRERKSQI